ncbi:hypothetical protein HDU77_000720, partial [Chytriomyces hyalinus]
STTLMLQFLMESARRLEDTVRRLEERENKNQDLSVRRLERLEEREHKNQDLIHSLLQNTILQPRTTIATNTIPISSTIFTAPVDAPAAAPGQRGAETCPTCDRAFPSASTAIPLVASAPAAQTIPSTARINDVDMVMTPAQAPATLLNNPQALIPKTSTATDTTKSGFAAPNNPANPYRLVSEVDLSTALRSPNKPSSPGQEPEFIDGPHPAAASAEPSTAIPKDQENPPVSGAFSKLNAAFVQGQGQGKGKEVAPMQSSTLFNRVNTTSLAYSSIPTCADVTRTVNPAPPTKAQLKELQERQGRESAASAAAIAKKILERNPVDQEAKRKREEFMRKTITEPVPGTRKITFPGNKLSQMYFLPFPRGGHSSVKLSATVSLLSLDAYNRIPAQYQPEMLQYTTRPHVWVHYQNHSDNQLIFEHPMGPTGVVDIGPYYKYEQLCEHVSYEQNSEGRLLEMCPGETGTDQPEAVVLETSDG